MFRITNFSVFASFIFNFIFKNKIKLFRTQGKIPQLAIVVEKSMTSCVDNDDGDEWKLVWPTLPLPHLLVLMCLI
jgi:hypothetical protein